MNFKKLSIEDIILIDPKGNIIDSNTLSPANPSLRKLLDELPGI